MTVTVTAVTLDDKNQERETQGGCSWFGCISTAPSYSVCRHIDPGQEEDSIGGEQLLLLARSQSEDDDEPKKTSSGNSSHEDHTTTTPPKPSATDTTLTTSVRETSEPSSSSSSHSHTSPPPPPAPPTSSSSTTATSTAQEPFPTDSPTSGATIAPPPATTIPASPSPSDTQPPASHGVTLSISALVGIVVSCAAVFLFAALSAYMWWRRYRRDKKEKEKAGDKGGGGGGLWSGFSRGSGSQRHQQHQQQQLGNQQPLADEDQFPLGMDSVFNPMAQNGPGSVFDRAQGCMGSVNSMLGRNSISSDSPTQLGSHTGAGTSKMSPEIPPTSPVELDSVPVGRGTAAPARPEKTAKPETRGSWWGEENSVLRATLNATEQERKAGMYANSWSKFQGVQL